jgi:uncharacterized RDD family membrane protein YckC
MAETFHYTQTEPEYVGFWLRFIAVLIDSVLISIVLYPLIFMLFGWELNYEGLGVGSTVVTYLLPAIVIVIFWICRSDTPGKIAIGAKIVDAKTGGKPSAGQFIGRYLGYYLSSIIFCLGFLWAAWDDRKQGWHDKLAGTVVVKSR